MLKLLAGVSWSRQIVIRCFGVALSLALVFAAVGFWEYGARELLLNPKVVASNQFKPYFRVNSLFFDPNVYGRFLAIVIVALAALLLWGRRQRDVVLASLALAVLWAALVLTFSQSSLAALLGGLAVLAALRWSVRWVAVATVAALAALLVAALAFPALLRVNLESERSLNRATSGRFQLMEGGVEMFADRPVWGHGAGSFAERFRARERVSSERAASASHTIPITVAAEQGVPGLAAYTAVLLAAFGLLFRALGELRGRAPPPRLVTRAYLAAAFAGLVLHTLLYAAFLEDPFTWTLLAAAIVLGRPEGRRAVSGASSAPGRTRSSSS